MNKYQRGYEEGFRAGAAFAMRIAEGMISMAQMSRMLEDDGED